jgi:hypothetical protein
MAAPIFRIPSETAERAAAFGNFRPRRSSLLTAATCHVSGIRAAAGKRDLPREVQSL